MSHRTEQTPALEEVPVLKVTVEVLNKLDGDGVLETLYTEASWFDIRETLCDGLDMYETAQDLTASSEENDRG
jgi:hypothetical protein